MPFVRLWNGPAGEVWRALPSRMADAGGEAAATGGEPTHHHILKVALDEHGAALLRAEADCVSRLVGDLDAPGSNAVLRLADGATGFDPPWLAYADRGASLAAHVSKRGALPESSTANLLRDILAGLAFAESRGVVHGALTPASVLVDGGFNAMLTDFRGEVWFDPSSAGERPATGRDSERAMVDSKVATAQRPISGASTMAATLSARQLRDLEEIPGWRLMYAGDATHFCDPLAYIAPEARRGVPLARSDLYSAGMIAAFAMLGDTPGRSFDTQLERAGISLTMRRIILRLTDPNPMLRYESAAAAMAVVETIYLERSRSVKFGRITSDPQLMEEERTIGDVLGRYKPLLVAVLVPLVIGALALLMMMVSKSMNGPFVP
ncbi:MAG: hypothetical protein AB7K09_24035 [Planctomycetota bacterium]